MGPEGRDDQRRCPVSVPATDTDGGEKNSTSHMTHDGTQHAARSIQHTSHSSTYHTRHVTQHAVHSTQHAAHSAQQPAPSTQTAGNRQHTSHITLTLKTRHTQLPNTARGTVLISPRSTKIHVMENADNTSARNKPNSVPCKQITATCVIALSALCRNTVVRSDAPNSVPGRPYPTSIHVGARPTKTTNPGSKLQV